MKASRKEHLARNEAFNWLKEKLATDPTFIFELRELIDEHPGEIRDEQLFELLKPTITKPWPAAKTCPPRVSPDSVDTLFLPEVRRKLKSWQQDAFDESLKDSQRETARCNLERVFRSLIFRGSGHKASVSATDEDAICRQRDDVKTTCQQILDASRLADQRGAYQKNLIQKEFPWCKSIDDRNRWMKKAASTNHVEELRACVLALKFNCTPRAIKEIIRRRREGFREFHRLLTKEPDIKTATISGTGSNLGHRVRSRAIPTTKNKSFL